MSGPTMVSTADELLVGRTTAPAWQAAVEQLADGSAAGAPEDRLVEWRAAGIIDGDHAVAPDWQLAIDAQSRASAVVTLVARMGDVAFLTHLFLSPAADRAVALTLRSVLEHRDGTDHVELVHPQAEVATADLRHLWPLLRRVLPPLEEFRADPAEVGADAAALPATPEALAAADAATASLLVHGVADGPHDDDTDDAVWYLTGGQLHRLSPRRQELRVVPAGDVASGLSTLVRRLLG